MANSHLKKSLKPSISPHFQEVRPKRSKTIHATLKSHLETYAGHFFFVKRYMEV